MPNRIPIDPSTILPFRNRSQGRTDKGVEQNRLVRISMTNRIERLLDPNRHPNLLEYLAVQSLAARLPRFEFPAGELPPSALRNTRFPSRDEHLISLQNQSHRNLQDRGGLTGIHFAHHPIVAALFEDVVSFPHAPHRPLPLAPGDW